MQPQLKPNLAIGDPTPRHKVEWLKCSRSVAYFVHTYGYVYDATSRDWLSFHLWAAQATTLQMFVDNKLVIVLKARQLGLSWLALGFALWLMIFRPAATILIFSKRDDEAVDLLDFRLKGMYHRLPAWMQARAVVEDSKHIWRLSNGSRAMAFPTSGGESYTATLAIMDEADKVQNLNTLLNAVKPTVDAGGRLLLISSVDKGRPQSTFKRIYQGAKEGVTEWKGVFLPWSARPGRSEEWYEGVKAEALARTGSLDDLHQEYPATDAEALSPRTLDKRIAPAWLQQCYTPLTPLANLPPGAPSIPGLAVYRLPEAGRQYVIGVDPAEGNPTSDDSALTVLDKQSGEEAAALAGKFQPSTLAAHADVIGKWFNNAGILVERNNHGHATLLWLRDNSKLKRLPGFDGREGWHSTTKGKALLYDAAADAFRHQETTVHTFTTYLQLASIEGSTLLAPEGERDDYADSYALAIVASHTRMATVTLS